MMKQVSQRERALTIYFATAAEKQAFIKKAAEFGMTASYLGALVLYRGMETGIMNQLDELMPGAISGVQSAPHQAVPQSRKTTKTHGQRRPKKAPKG